MTAGRCSPNCYGGPVCVTTRKPPNTQYKISEFRRTQPTATIGPSNALGTSDIHGIAKGRSKIPDSPESAGFFDATKNTQAKTEIIDKRSNPAASMPLRENLNASAIVLPPNGLAHWCQLLAHFVRSNNHNPARSVTENVR